MSSLFKLPQIWSVDSQKIIIIVANIAAFSTKRTKFDFGWVSFPNPARVTTSRSNVGTTVDWQDSTDTVNETEKSSSLARRPKRNVAYQNVRKIVISK